MSERLTLVTPSGTKAVYEAKRITELPNGDFRVEAPDGSVALVPCSKWGESSGRIEAAANGGYSVYLSDGSRVTVPNYEFGARETLLVWRDAEAEWPFILTRREWLRVCLASNVINAAASGGTRKVKRKRSKVHNELHRYLAERETGPGWIFGRVLLGSDHYAAGRDGGVYVYEGGVYVPAESHVKRQIQGLASDKWTRHIQNEVLAWLHSASEELDDSLDPDVINVKNGLLRWTGKGWRLTKHDPELRTTMQLPVRYDRKAKCPTYDRFLASSQPEKAVRGFLDEWMGYNLTPDCGQEKALINLGSSGAGKSVYLHVLGELLGASNVAGKTLQSLVVNRFATADLYGKLANICADLSATELKATGIFKELVSGDLISAEKKMKDPFHFRNVAKLSFSANEIPGSPDGTTAYFDRWRAVGWYRKFRKTDDEIEGLKERIARNPREMSGVLNRALAGITRLRLGGQFTSSPALQMASDEFRVGSDNVASYLLDVSGPRKRQTREVWYADYDAWCKTNGRRSLGSNTFYERMRDWHPAHGIEVKATKSKGYEYFAVTREVG